MDNVQPIIITLSRKPHGWCVIPKTTTVLHWNILTLNVTDFRKNKNDILRTHSSKVISGVASTSTAITGDYAGFICVWYTASWKCHHHISTGHEPCHEIQLNDNNEFAVRTTNNIYIYNLILGRKKYDFSKKAVSMKYTAYGLVVGTSKEITIYDISYSPTVVFQHECLKLIKHASCHNLWSVSNRQIRELRFSREYIDWSEECLRWVKNPKFPIHQKWPRRYMDVLALSVEEWLPLVEHSWDPPREWFRHVGLKHAIWDACLKFEYTLSKSWNHLNHKNLTMWYEKCLYKIETLVLDIDYNVYTFTLINEIYRYIDINSKAIHKWCWFHQGKVIMRHLLIYLTENNDFFLENIENEPSTPDSIMCFSSVAVLKALKKNKILIFIRWLQQYHNFYTFEPTHHMRKIYGHLLSYIYEHIDKNTLDMPLVDSGTWKTVEKLTMNHQHAYISNDGTEGFVHSIQMIPNEEILWTPIHSNGVKLFSKGETLKIWSYYNTKSPRNILECALTLLKEDMWTKKSLSTKWNWFKSELGAFMAEGCSIHVFETTMQIERAEWSDTGAHIYTDTKFSLGDSEAVDIYCMSPAWSYMDENLYHIIPLKLKIANSIVLTVRPIHLELTYAPELFQCCSSKTIQIEYEWKTTSMATAIVSLSGMFFVGCQNGIIYEYDTMSNIHSITRTFEHHTLPIKHIHIQNRSLISLCDDHLNICCLTTGRLIMTIETKTRFLNCMPINDHYFWVVQEYKNSINVVLWDIHSEIPVKKLDTTEFKEGEIFCTSLPSPIIIVNRDIYMLDDKIRVFSDLDIKGKITCIHGDYNHVFGGTDEGVLFMLNINTEEFSLWTPSKFSQITAIASLEDHDAIIIGMANGKIAIWDIFDAEFTMFLSISDRPIQYIFVEGLIVMASCYKTIKLMSVVRQRSKMTLHLLNTVITWSEKWKSRLIKDAETYIEPVVVSCILKREIIPEAILLLDECTKNYQDRISWCSPGFIDILLLTPIDQIKHILRRLVAFRGPKFECAICNDEHSDDSISLIKTCNHRFHTGCIAQLIRKVPEYNDEMQYEYALSVSLRCPICRTPFESEDVEEDKYLNKYLHIPYKQINK